MSAGRRKHEACLEQLRGEETRCASLLARARRAEADLAVATAALAVAISVINRPRAGDGTRRMSLGVSELLLAEFRGFTVLADFDGLRHEFTLVRP
jgi:hypothetical protein